MARRPGLALLALMTVLLVGARADGCGSPDPGTLRILEYNVAFLYLAADLPFLPFPGCASCDPLEPGPIPCSCPSITIWPNERRFADLSEPLRAQKLAERIRATDQDVVVLNEVFHPAARQAFITTLATNGPYDHYISKLAGHAVVEPTDLGELAQYVTEDSLLVDLFGELLSTLPDFLQATPIPGDSGLMIFSKYPFLPLTGPTVPNDAACPDPECVYAGSSSGVPIQPGSFAFRVYDACNDSDCLASKGVGLVKVNHPTGPSYVAFSHLQADYQASGGGAFPETRAAQLETIRDVLVGSIPAAELTDAAVYLAGDTNVPGASRLAPQVSATQEWHDLFDPASSNPNVAGGFFACGNGVVSGGSTSPCRFGVNGTRQLIDSWGFETSPTDRGISNTDDGARLDYLLHSARNGATCMQHVMTAWDLLADAAGDGGLTWLSDHLPLRGDLASAIGTALLHCSPNDDPAAAVQPHALHPLAFGPTGCIDGGTPACHQDETVAPPTARLTLGGSFQWFQITQAGSYSIRVDPAVSEQRVSFSVYHHTDLSRPMRPFDEQPNEWGTPFSLPDPPYYIRTYAVDETGAADRLAAGRQYTLHVHQHLCRSPMDHCFLDPGRARAHPYAYTWPTTTANPITELRELWWRFKTGSVKDGRIVGPDHPSGDFPRVEMFFESPNPETQDCITAIAPTLEEWNDGTAPTQLIQSIPFVGTTFDVDVDYDDDGLQDELRLAPDLGADVDDVPKDYFLKLTRASSYLDPFNPCNAGLTSYTGYLTTLTYFVAHRLQMYSKLNDVPAAKDRVRIHLGFDSGGFLPNPPAISSVTKSFTEPSSGSVSVDLFGYPMLRGYYVSALWPTLFETGESTVLAPLFSFSGLETLSGWDPSSPGQGVAIPSSQAPSLIYADDFNASGADYYYALWHRRCHLETETACDIPHL